MPLEFALSAPLELPAGDFAAYIFDCDGTLADTMPTHYKAWRIALGEYSCEFPEAMFYELGGVPTAYVCENFACQLPVTDASALDVLLE